jgi:hypothetical protein
VSDRIRKNKDRETKDRDQLAFILALHPNYRSAYEDELKQLLSGETIDRNYNKEIWSEVISRDGVTSYINTTELTESDQEYD